MGAASLTARVGARAGGGGRRTLAASSAAVALALLGSAAMPAGVAHAATPGPSGPAFYTPPSPLPAGPHGTLIWYTPINVSSSGISNATAFTVLYKSSSASQNLAPVAGAADAVSGTVIVPNAAWTGPGKRPIITFDVGTQGMGSNCAASKEIAAGTEYDIIGIQAALNAGYAVTVTDYEGYTNGGTHTYVVGQSAGHATLDIVTAATQLPGASAAGITSANPVGIWGYSEGGQAADWAAQEQATYAPSMHVIGVAAGGVPGDLKVTATSLNGGLGSAFLFDAVIGLHTAYPALPFTSLINSAGVAAFAKITAPSECVFNELTDFGFKNISTYTNSGQTLAQLLTIPQWSAALDANQLGNTRFAAPLYSYHALLDEIIPTSTEDQLATNYCKLGMSVQKNTYYLADHLTADFEAVGDVTNFFKARVAGTAPVSNC